MLEYINSIIKIFLLSTKIVIQKRVKIIHVANPPDFFWLLAILCKLLGIKFIYDQHDIAPEMYKLKFGEDFFYKLLLLNEKLSIRFADKIIVVNNSFKKD